MGDQTFPPRPYQLDQLRELMERVGEPEERADKLLTVAPVDHQ